MLSNSFFTPHACRVFSQAIFTWRYGRNRRWSSEVILLTLMHLKSWRFYKELESFSTQLLRLCFLLDRKCTHKILIIITNTSNFFHFHISTKLMKLFNSFVFFFCFSWNFCACFLLLNYRTEQRKFWFVFVFFVKLWTQLTSHHDEMK